MASKSTITRRRMLQSAGLAAVGGGACALVGCGVAGEGGAPAAQAQSGSAAIASNAQGGRKFKAFVKVNTANVPTVMELTVRPLQARQVLLRTQAAQTCYTSIDQVLIPGTPATQATIVGHGGVGIVEAIGPQVLSCRVGDRAIVNLHAACGRCFNCLRQRSDKCRNGGAANPLPGSQMSDGTPVFSYTGGMTELMITNEEYVTPIFTDVPAADISMLTCVGGCGLGMTMTNSPVEAGSDVVVFGGGPVGLASVMGAKVKGASRIILVEPIAYRRALGLKLGATDAVDPNMYKGRTPIPNAAATGDHFKDELVDHLREMTKEKSDRLWAGAGRIGPDHVIEAVGGDKMKPKEVQGPDPTGVTVLNQCWELESSVGTLVTCSVGQPNNAFISIPAAQWADGAKHHWPGTGGGTNDRRDSGRYVRLMETGQINMKATVGKTYALSQTKEAYQACADRTTISTVVTPNT